MSIRENKRQQEERRAIILTALPIEYQAVRAHLTDLHEEVHEQGTVYETGRFTSENGNWAILLVEAGANNQRATLEAERAIQHFQPHVALFVGVAGGLKDVAIGDVVAAPKVYGYESGKDRSEFEARPDVGESSYALEQRARAVARKSDWLSRVLGTQPVNTTKALVSPIAAGEKVVADTRSAIYQFLRKHYGDAVAVEMEGRGFLTATRANRGVDALVIRGISDCIDAKAEADLGGSQELASRHASAFAFEVLARFNFPDNSRTIQTKKQDKDGPIWTVPSPRTPGFTGRSTVLQQIYEHFTSASSNSTPQAIFGLGGIGKTRLAVEYAARHALDEKHYSHVLWLRADDPAVLVSDYASLAEVLDLPEKEDSEQASKISAVQRWLQTTHQNWLLIFDNAENSETIRPYLPPSYHGHVLITSRNPAWGSLATARRIDELSLIDSVAFLRQRTGQNDDAAATDLAAALGGLPLALVQASAYIEQTEKSLADYLLLFEQRKQDLLSRPGAPPDYPYTVAVTWELSFEQTRNRIPAAADLLALCSFLAPSPIPIETIKTGAKLLPTPLANAVSDDIRLDELIATLRQYSLVHVTNGALLFHRLVQVVMSHRLRDDQKQWALFALRFTHRFFYFDQEDLQSRQWCAFFLPHALTASRYAWELEVGFDILSELLSHLGGYLEEQAEYHQARVVISQGIKASQISLGLNHPTAIRLLQQQGEVSFRLGEFKEAQTYLERALELARADVVQGAPQLREASILNDLSLVFLSIGSLPEAQKHAERSLALQEESLGKDHPQISSVAGNLGVIIMRQARFDEARPYIERSISITKLHLGPSNPKVAVHLNTLGNLLSELGRYSDAQECFMQALELIKQNYGLDHPNAAAVLRNIGDVHQRLGNLEYARQFCELALRIDESCFGPDHASVATDLNNLARALHELGNYSKALTYLERARSIMERTYGPNSSELATTLSNLGRTQEALRDKQSARISFERALRICEQTLGPDHPDVAQILNNIGHLFTEHPEDLPQAQLYIERALAIDERVYGPNHQEVAIDLYNLALNQSRQGKQKKAINLLRRVLSIHDSGQVIPPTLALNAMLEQGSLHLQRREWSKAKQLLERALKEQERIAPQDFQTSQILSLLGDIHFAQGKYTAARKNWEQALVVGEGKLGRNDPMLRPILQRLAQLNRNPP